MSNLYISPKSFFSWSNQIYIMSSANIFKGQRQVPIFTGELNLYWSTPRFFYGNSELFGLTCQMFSVHGLTSQNVGQLPRSQRCLMSSNLPWVPLPVKPQFFDRSKGSSEEAPVKVAPWQWLGKPSPFWCAHFDGGSNKMQGIRCD